MLIGLQFVINQWISISMIRVDLWITNSSLTIIIDIVLIITAYKLSIERGYIVPTRLQSVVEILYETVYCFIQDNIIFIWFIYTVVLNLMGMIPYIIWIFGIWFGVTLRGLNLNGINFLSMFMSSAHVEVSIVLASSSARAFSLSVCLVANISAGHLLLTILSGFTWTMLAITVIQAYVFTLLTCICINSISLLLAVSTFVRVFFIF